MIVATAGHVDHGKTSLVKQLTGVDTDRLQRCGLVGVAGGGQHGEPWRGFQQWIDPGGDGADEVLAIVDHEERAQP